MSNLPQRASASPFEITDRESSELYEDYRDVAINYYEAKCNFLRDAYNNAVTYIPSSMLESFEVAQGEDKL